MGLGGHGKPTGHMRAMSYGRMPHGLNGNDIYTNNSSLR